MNRFVSLVFNTTGKFKKFHRFEYLVNVACAGYYGGPEVSRRKNKMHGNTKRTHGKTNSKFSSDSSRPHWL